MNRSSSNSVYTNVIRRSRKMSSFLGENHENPGNKTKNQEPAKRNEDEGGFLPILPEESSTSTVFHVEPVIDCLTSLTRPAALVGTEKSI